MARYDLDIEQNSSEIAIPQNPRARPMRGARLISLSGGLLAVVLAAGLSTKAQQPPDAALKDRVNQLVERLDAPKVEARDAAEAALIKLGLKAIPLLPDAKAAKNAEVRGRLDKVRQAIAEAQDESNLGASIVTIKGKGLRLNEALKQLQVQSGNTVTDLREQFGAEATNPALDLDIEAKPFFEALDIITEKAGLSINFFTGDGTIGLMAGAAMMDGEKAATKDETKTAATPAPKPLRIYSGPFRVLFKQMIVSRDLQSGLGKANAQFEVAWEPRLRPMLLALKAEEIEIEDDRGGFIGADVTAETSSVVLRHENPAAEVNLNLDGPDRRAIKIKKLKFKADVTLPAGIKSFRFPSLAKQDVTQKQNDVGVTYESMDIDEGTWKVRVNLSYPGEGPAFESYRQGLFNNRVFLQKADGSRYDLDGPNGGGFNQTANDGGNLGFEYLFVDLPGKPADYQLVYETPSKVLTVPLQFEFVDVPLP